MADWPVDGGFGQKRDVAGALQIAAVYGCVSLIAGRIAALPVDMMGGRKPAWMTRPIADDGMFGLSFSDLLTSVVTSMLLRGTAYLAVGRDRRGVVMELMVLDPNKVSVERIPSGELIVRVDGKPTDYDILPIRYLVLPGSLVGLSPLDACAQLLSVGEGGTELAASFFERGAVVPGVLSAASSLEDVDRDSLVRSWKSAHAGASRAHRPLILEQGLEYTPIGVTPEQAQFLETRQLTDAQIAAQIFHVDPSLVGVHQSGSSVTYQTVELRERQLLLDAILPILTRIEGALSTLVAGEVKFNVDQTLRPSLKTRYESYKIAAEVGFMTIDEMRELEGLPPLEKDEDDETGTGAPDLGLVVGGEG